MHQEYDSYAYLIVTYFIDTKEKEYLISLLRDNNKLELEKDGLLNRAIIFYNNKYKSSISKIR